MFSEYWYIHTSLIVNSVLSLSVSLCLSVSLSRYSHSLPPRWHSLSVSLSPPREQRAGGPEIKEAGGGATRRDGGFCVLSFLFLILLFPGCILSLAAQPQWWTGGNHAHAHAHTHAHTHTHTHVTQTYGLMPRCSFSDIFFLYKSMGTLYMKVLIFEGMLKVQLNVQFLWIVSTVLTWKTSLSIAKLDWVCL